MSSGREDRPGLAGEAGAGVPAKGGGVLRRRAPCKGCLGSDQRCSFYPSGGRGGFSIWQHLANLENFGLGAGWLGWVHDSIFVRIFKTSSPVSCKCQRNFVKILKRKHSFANIRPIQIGSFQNLFQNFRDFDGSDSTKAFLRTCPRKFIEISRKNNPTHLWKHRP